MITEDQLRKIIRGIELTVNGGRPIGTKVDNGVVVSLREDAQAPLLELLCKSINEQLKDNKQAEWIASLPCDRYAEHD